jgi:hypothetical protein
LSTASAPVQLPEQQKIIRRYHRPEAAADEAEEAKLLEIQDLQKDNKFRDEVISKQQERILN